MCYCVLIQVVGMEGFFGVIFMTVVSVFNIIILLSCTDFFSVLHVYSDVFQP